MPIRFRLALWYSTLFAAVLTIFSVAIYVFMVRHLDDMLQTSLVSRVDHLSSSIQTLNEHDGAEDGLQVPSLDAFETSEIYVQVSEIDGKVVANSSNLEGRTLPTPEPVFSSKQDEISLDGIVLRQLSTRVLADDEPVALLQVAGSYRQRDLVLGRLRWVLSLGGITAVGLLGLISSGLAGRVLSPIAEITETARAIALSHGFSRRLETPRSNDELGGLARTFNEMLASLEEAYTAQRRFTADASHELRAPLTAIRGNLELVDRIENMPESERQHALSQVRSEVSRLSRLVTDLLDLARADAGQELHLENVELDQLLIDVHRQSLVTADGVTVKIDHLEPVVIEGDADRLKELLLNLVENACKYTPEGGSVTLSLLSSWPWAVLTVEDTGIGIDAEDLPHVFERFWRADKARSRDSGGTGLGLAIARWITERHGGEISLSSEPGNGTRVDVRIPIAS